MAASIRDQIVAAVLARFQTINGTGNYVNNLSGSCKVWRTTDFNYNQSPEISITDPEEDITQYTGGIWTPEIKFEIWVGAGNGDNTSYDVAQGLKDVFADLTYAIGAVTNGVAGRLWNNGTVNLAYDTVPGKNEAILDQAENIYGLGVFRFSIKYRMKSFQPDTLA